MRFHFGDKVSVEISDSVTITLGLTLLLYMAGHLNVETLQHISPLLHSLLT